MKIYLYADDIIINALILLNKNNGRRCITWKEIEKFKLNLRRKARLQNINLKIMFGNCDFDENLFLYVDTLMLGLKKIYRLKPQYNREDLVEAFNCNLSLDTLVFLSDSSLVQNLNAFSLETEREIETFQKIDEKHQLECIYNLCLLEKKKRVLERQLININKNAFSLTDILSTSDISENVPSGLANYIDININAPER